MVRVMPSQAGTSIKECWGDQLRLARLKLRESQAEAGEAIGLQGPTVSRAENGRGSLDVFHRLARRYGVVLEAGNAS
jgi:transcriptional regulator with XRE-family HTH domain